MSDERLRVLICGSRTYREHFPIQAILQRYWTVGPFMLIHGAAKGADSLAGFYAQKLGVEIEEYPADWSLGKRAGFVRNTRMLEEGRPDVVWAFVDKPLSESKGTKMMVDIARKGGVQCYVVETEPLPPEPIIERKGL